MMPHPIEAFSENDFAEILLGNEDDSISLFYIWTGVNVYAL